MIYVGQYICQEAYDEYLKEYREMTDKIKELESELSTANSDAAYEADFREQNPSFPSENGNPQGEW